MVPSEFVFGQCLRFLVCLCQDLGRGAAAGAPGIGAAAVVTGGSKSQHLDMTDLSLQTLWKLYSGFSADDNM